MEQQQHGFSDHDLFCSMIQKRFNKSIIILELKPSLLGKTTLIYFVMVASKRPGEISQIKMFNLII